MHVVMAAAQRELSVWETRFWEFPAFTCGWCCWKRHLPVAAAAEHKHERENDDFGPCTT